jgi:hypothetical protein
MSVETTHYAATALFALSENLEDEENSKAFEDVLLTLHMFARRWPFAKEILQTLQLATVQEAKLPLAARILLSEYDDMQSATSNS